MKIARAALCVIGLIALMTAGTFAYVSVKSGTHMTLYRLVNLK